jgi:Kef-type K+ transport system membrane component KefB
MSLASAALVSLLASLAEVIPVLLLSLLFSAQASDLGSQIALLAAFCALAAAAALPIFGLERWRWIGRALLALQDTTAQIRVRAAVALLMSFAALAAGLGLEAILGSFLAGAAISLLDRDRALTLARVPIFLAAILIARGLPALLYRPLLISSAPRATPAPGATRRQVMTAGLLQATSLSIPIVGGSIGVNLGLIRPGNYVALVAAGLVSVIAFPVIASVLTAERERA